MRADRLGVAEPTLLVLAETNVEAILEQARAVEPVILAVDSIQTMFTERFATRAIRFAPSELLDNLVALGRSATGEASTQPAERRRAKPIVATATSSRPAISSPVGEAAGAGAASDEQTPSLPGRLQACAG